MLFKSFLKNKNIKCYFMLILVCLVSINIIFYFSNYLNNIRDISNSKIQNRIITVYTLKKSDEYKNREAYSDMTIQYKDMEQTLSYRNFDYFLKLDDEQLDYNEVLLPQNIVTTEKKGDIINLNINNDSYSFIIKDIYDEKDNYIFVSYNFMKKHGQKTPYTYDYIAPTADKVDAMINSLDKDSQYTISPAMGTGEFKKIDNIVKNVNYIKIILLLICSVILFTILYNLIIDHKTNIAILKSLGFRNKKISLNMISYCLIILIFSTLVVAFLFNLFLLIIQGSDFIIFLPKSLINFYLIMFVVFILFSILILKKIEKIYCIDLFKN